MADHCRKCKSRLVTCPTCKGKGTTDQGNFYTVSHRPCPNCNETGNLCPRHGHDHG